MYKVLFDVAPPVPEEQLAVEVARLEKLIKSNLDLQYTGDDFKSRAKLQSVLGAADVADRGFINRKEFEAALKTLNIFPSPAVTSYWFYLYSPKGDGKFDYKGCVRAIYGVVTAPRKCPTTARVLDDVLAKVIARGAGAMPDLTRSFRIMDKNRDQKLSATEFKVGLQRYGAVLSDEDVKKVIKAFDRDNSGSINVTEFLVALRGYMNDRRRQLVLLAFKQLDRDNSGVIEFREIASVYDATRHPEVLAGRKTIEDVLRDFIKDWDADGDDQITIDEFMDYYNTLSASIDNDDYFELMIRNAWHLAGGKGWCENTSNLRVLVVHSDDSEEVVCLNNDLGLNKRDDAAVRRLLESQGVQDIKRVALAF